MAGLTDMFSIGGGVDSVASTLYGVVKIVLVLAVIAGVFYYFYNKKQYKYGVRLKVLQNGRFVSWEGVAKVKLDDNKISFWYIKGLKELVDIPPNESMSITSTGRWIAEGYYDRTTGVFWGKDTTTEKDFQKKIKEVVLEGGERKSGSHSIDTYHEPFSTTQRSLLAARISRAMQRKGKDVWAMIWQILPVMVLVVIFVLVLIFWNDIAKPVISLAGTNAQISADNKLMQEQNIRLYSMLTGGKGNGTSYVVQQIPSDQQYFIPERPGGNTS